MVMPVKRNAYLSVLHELTNKTKTLRYVLDSYYSTDTYNVNYIIIPSHTLFSKIKN